MSSRSSNVYIHQSTSGPSSGSSSSRSSSSSAPSNSRNVSSRREYDARDRTTQVVQSRGSVVINHNRTDYQTDSPSPYYRGTY